MNKISIGFVIFSSFYLHAFTSTEEASKIMMPFKKEMMKTLKTSIKSDGIKGAVKTCHLKAPEITSSYRSEVVAIGRTSLKYRNKNNKPEKWMIPILSEYESSKNKEPRIVHVGKDSYYVEPIYVKGLCLNCHGKLSGSIKEAITTSYPHDKAQNYKVGDFRGLFWMRSVNSN